jgi:hypothetical protein
MNGNRSLALGVPLLDQVVALSEPSPNGHLAPSATGPIRVPSLFDVAVRRGPSDWAQRRGGAILYRNE